MARPHVTIFCAAAVLAAVCVSTARAEQAFERQWGRTYTTQDWNRLYHYPYVYYPPYSYSFLPEVFAPTKGGSQ